MNLNRRKISKSYGNKEGKICEKAKHNAECLTKKIRAFSAFVNRGVYFVKKHIGVLKNCMPGQ